MSLLLCSHLSTVPHRVIGSFDWDQKYPKSHSFYPPHATYQWLLTLLQMTVCWHQTDRITLRSFVWVQVGNGVSWTSCNDCLGSASAGEQRHRNLRRRAFELMWREAEDSCASLWCESQRTPLRLGSWQQLCSDDRWMSLEKVCLLYLNHLPWMKAVPLYEIQNMPRMVYIITSHISSLASHYKADKQQKVRLQHFPPDSKA